MKLCPSCKTTKPLEDFSNNPRNNTGKSSYCKPCMVVRSREYRKKFPDRDKEIRRRAWLRWKVKNPDRYQKRILYYICQKYNISIEDYQSLFDQQNGLCKICKSTSNRRLNVDHCHITGKIRGLLCTNCNQGLGHFKDDATLLKKAIQYLKTVNLT